MSDRPEAFVAEAHNQATYNLNGERSTIAEVVDYLTKSLGMNVASVPSTNTRLIIIPDGGDRPRVKEGTNGLNLKNVTVAALGKVIKEHEKEEASSSDDDDDDDDEEKKKKTEDDDDDDDEEDDEDDDDEESEEDVKPTPKGKPKLPAKAKVVPSPIAATTDKESYRQEVKRKMGIKEPPVKKAEVQPKTTTERKKKEKEKEKEEKGSTEFKVWVAPDPRRAGYKIIGKNIEAPLTRIQANRFASEVLGLVVLKNAAKSLRAVIVPDLPESDLSSAYSFERKIVPPNVEWLSLTKFIEQFKPDFLQDSSWHTKLIAHPLMLETVPKRTTKPKPKPKPKLEEPKTTTMPADDPKVKKIKAKPKKTQESKNVTPQKSVIDTDNSYLFFSDPVYTCWKEAKFAQTYQTFADFQQAAKTCDAIQTYNWTAAHRRIGALVNLGQVGQASWEISTERDSKGEVQTLTLKRVSKD